ncbi:hypothetical protein BJ912DRAFT_961543 [Pholiota molesta]|nr:hypothetical protein BJ912DRAFT_961543 [Pholiota molesta]
MTTTSRVVIRRAPANPLSQEFPLSESDLPPILAAFLVSVPFLSVHAILFLICMRILLGRRRSVMKTAMLIAVVVMFGLATGDVAVSWHIILGRTSILYTGTTTKLQHAIRPKLAIHFINKSLTRCYVVLGNRTIVLYVGGFGLIVETLCGIITGAVPEIPDLIAAYFSIVLGFNFVLTAVTAIRIMWIAKEVKKALGPQMASNYHFSVGVLVESGMIYTSSMLLLIIFGKSIYLVLAAAINLRVVGIVPILIIVQIATGQAMEDVKTTVTRQEGGTQQIVLDTMFSEGYEAEVGGNHEPFTREDEETGHRGIP